MTQRFSLIKRLNSVATAMLIFSMAIAPLLLRAQDGADLFRKHCSVCHTIGQGDLVGPDLKGVNDRHERDWLVAFIHNSQEVIASGDPVAVELYNKYKKAIMPPFTQLSDDEVGAILVHIASSEPVVKEALTVDVSKRTGFNHEEYLRGERIFHGLIPLQDGLSYNCTNCHNTVTSDTLNWNPSAMDLAEAFMDPNGFNIYQSMNQPGTAKMEQAHQGIKMSEEDIYYVAAYLSHFRETGMAEHKILPVKLLLFIAFGILMTLAIIDLLFTHRVKYRVIHVVILLAGLSVHGWLAYVEAVNLSRTPDYAPDQPIKFSHKIHAGQNKTDCRYCHFTVEFSKTAGIPSLNTCMNCHNVVKTGTRSGSFEINKISRAIASGLPVQWIRVHNLPDHAYFNHSQHVKVGLVECQTCHGEVEQMDILRQVSDLSMGWCVNCHRNTEVNFEGNKYYSTFKNYHSEEGGRPTVDNVGGIDCMKCHY